MSHPKYSHAFSVGERGRRFMEILRDGEPFHIAPGFTVGPFFFDAHGAKALSVSWKYIEDFHASNGLLPKVGERKLAFMGPGGSITLVWKRLESFKDDAGRLVDRPYLSLSESVDHKERFIVGFGLDKAAGLLDQRAAVDEFAESDDR